MNRSAVTLLAVGSVSFFMPITGFADGNSLLLQCKKFVEAFENSNEESPSQDMTGAAYCAGLMEGFVHGVQGERTLWELAEGVRGRLTCFPEDISTVQLARVVVKYLDDRPESLHFENGTLLAAAFKDAFPCPPESD